MCISWILQGNFCPQAINEIGRRIVSSGGYAYGRILCCGNPKIPGVFGGTKSWCCCRRNVVIDGLGKVVHLVGFFRGFLTPFNGGPFSFGWLFLRGFRYKLTWGSQVSVEWFIWFRRTLDSKTTFPVRKGHSSHSFVFPTSIKIQELWGNLITPFITLPSSPHLQSFLAKCQRSALPQHFSGATFSKRSMYLSRNYSSHPLTHANFLDGNPPLDLPTLLLCPLEAGSHGWFVKFKRLGFSPKGNLRCQRW